MKIKPGRIALVALASIAALCAGSASAQVTLYGRLNLSVERQKTDAGSKYVEQNSSSRFGLKGYEDLGGGLGAGFQLESGISADTGGAGAPFWGRQSEVYLSNSSVGKLRLGLFTSDAYYATADYVSNHNHDTGSSADALYGGFQRAPNGIGYESPEFVPGLRVNVATGLGEGVPGLRRTNDLAVNYKAGDLALGLGYNSFNSAFAAARGATANQLAVRAYYTLGPWGFGGYVQRDEDAFAAGRRTNVRLSGMYTLGGSEFHLNVGSAGSTGNVANSSARQYTLAYNYNLSKRTKVYGFFTKINDNAAALYGGDFQSLALGIRHNF